MSKSTIPVICLDGPSGVGKGTICLAVAEHLGWHILDSGSLYRITALQVSRLFSTDDVDSINKSQLYDIAFTDYQHVYFMDLYMKTATVRNIAYYEKGTIDDRIIGGR